MLIEFRIENYRSLRDEQVLSMEAARLGDPDDTRLRHVPGSPKQLLTVAAIYGANASGKTNVLEAIAFMRDFVIVSQYRHDPFGVQLCPPFAWGISRGEPTLLEVVLVLDGIRYQYGFTVSGKSIKEEWLYAWPGGRRQEWFVRQGSEFKFGGRFKGENQLIRGVTRPEALFLSTAAMHGHPGTRAVYDYFGRCRKGNSPVTSAGRRLPVLHEVAHFEDIGDEELLRDRILPLLREADVGIVDIRMNEASDKFNFWGKQGGRDIEFKHDPDDDDSWLALDHESLGTQTLFHNAGSLLLALDHGTFVLFDELDSRLHPAMAEKIVAMFNDPRSNHRNAQLIFTTHNTNLLGNTLGEPVLRRDQVWFTEKDGDGATRLYPLSDFNVRKMENVERGYLQGRYGAVPVLGDLIQAEE